MEAPADDVRAFPLRLDAAQPPSISCFAEPSAIVMEGYASASCVDQVLSLRDVVFAIRGKIDVADRRLLEQLNAGYCLCKRDSWKGSATRRQVQVHRRAGFHEDGDKGRNGRSRASTMTSEIPTHRQRESTSGVVIAGAAGATRQAYLGGRARCDAPPAHGSAA